MQLAGGTVRCYCYEYSYRTASHIRQGLQGCCYFLEIACYSFLILEGRESDVIVTARVWNVNSAEVTQAVSSHPELEGSVVTVAGVDGAGGHQEVCCWIVMRAGKQQVAVDDLVSFLHGRLSDYKIPRWFRFVESLPVNRNFGKINMSELRKSFVLEKPQQPRENTNILSSRHQLQ